MTEDFKLEAFHEMIDVAKQEIEENKVLGVVTIVVISEENISKGYTRCDCRIHVAGEINIILQALNSAAMSIIEKGLRL